jgi:hypothetical protein
LGRYSGSTTPQTMVATVLVSPSVIVNPAPVGPVLTSTIVAQGKFGLAATNPGDSTTLMYPAIATGVGGQTFLIASGMRSDLNPSAVTATLSTSGGFTTATNVTLQTAADVDRGFTCTTSPAPHVAPVCRWGDYSAAVTIYDISQSLGNPTALPSPAGVIGATETISPNQVKDSHGTVTSNWGTVIVPIQ